MRTSVKHGSRLAAVLLVSALGLSACGSDNDSDGGPVAGAPPPGAPPAAPQSGVPASAGGSIEAYIAYLKGLQTDETSSPVNIGSFMPPVDDAAAPTLLGS